MLSLFESRNEYMSLLHYSYLDFLCPDENWGNERFNHPLGSSQDITHKERSLLGKKNNNKGTGKTSIVYREAKITRSNWKNIANFDLETEVRLSIYLSFVMVFNFFLDPLPSILILRVRKIFYHIQGFFSLIISSQIQHFRQLLLPFLFLYCMRLHSYKHIYRYIFCVCVYMFVFMCFQSSFSNLWYCGCVKNRS